MQSNQVTLGKTRALRVYAQTFKVEGRTEISYKTVVKFKHKDEAGCVVLDEEGKPKMFEHQVDLKFLKDENREDGFIVKKLIGNSNGYLYANAIDKPEFFEHYYSEKKKKEVYPEVWIKNIVKFEAKALEPWVNPYKMANVRQTELDDSEFDDILPDEVMPWDK